MPSQAEHIIHAVIFKHGENWVAQCLEHDIATQATSLDAVLYELERIVVAQLFLSTKEHPFDAIPKAPKRFWEMQRSARSSVRKVLALEIPFPVQQPRPTLHVAFATEKVAA